MSHRYCILLLLFALTIFAPADWLCAGDFDSDRQSNWHQWRGPDATGVAPNANPPIEWDATKNLKWKAAIPGHGEIVTHYLEEQCLHHDGRQHDCR